MSQYKVMYEYTELDHLIVEALDNNEAEEIAVEELDKKYPGGGVFITEVIPLD